MGIDFLGQYRYVIDVCGGDNDNIGRDNTIKRDVWAVYCYLSCFCPVDSSHYHEVRLQVQLEGENADGDYVGLFQPKTEMSTHHGLLFACSVSPVHEGMAVVQLVNPSSVPAILHSRERICRVSLLEELDGVNMVERALDPKPPSRSPEAFGKAVDELMDGHLGCQGRSWLGLWMAIWVVKGGAG